MFFKCQLLLNIHINKYNIVNEGDNVMNVDDFLKATEPKVKRSVLDPFYDDIKKLRDHGRTLSQVCDYLKLNNVEITVAGLSKFLERRNKNKIDSVVKKIEKTVQSITQEDDKVTEIADDTNGLNAKQKREKNADKYCPESTNPLLKRLKSNV
jgi:DNA-binding transcriptional MerR regulator